MPITSIAGVVALTVAMSLLTGCSDDGTEAADPASPTTPAEADPTSPTTPAEVETPVATETRAETEAPAETETPDEPAELEDGRHPAYIAATDIKASTITVDVIQFLTGEDAVAAHAEDHPDEPEGPASEYYIRNVNPRLRTLPVASDVAVTVLWLDSDIETENITFDELPAYFTTNPGPESKYEWLLPFWLTVRDGQVTAIEEQYLP